MRDHAISLPYHIDRDSIVPSYEKFRKFQSLFEKWLSLQSAMQTNNYVMVLLIIVEIKTPLSSLVYLYPIVDAITTCLSTAIDSSSCSLIIFLLIQKHLSYYIIIKVYHRASRNPFHDVFFIVTIIFTSEI